MGKKRVGETYNASSLCKKSSRASSSSNAPTRSKGKKDDFSLILPLCSRRLHLASDEQKSKYKPIEY